MTKKLKHVINERPRTGLEQSEQGVKGWYCWLQLHKGKMKPESLQSCIVMREEAMATFCHKGNSQ